MSKPKFTLGPWRLYSTHIVEAEGRKPQLPIAKAYAGQDAIANARLIAAAPDLYEAIDLMLMHGERCNWFADRGDEEVCEQARAALAKARGETP